MVTVEDVRALALGLPRTHEALVHDRVKFRVGQIVYAALSRDETVMGFGFPRDERDALVQTEPGKFMLPRQSDLRFNWVLVRLDAIDVAEMRELVLDAWRMVVPKGVAAAHLLGEMYDAFNARDIDRVLEQMTDDVDWPNAWEGGRLVGRAAVRDYWTRQWAEIDPRVEPVAFKYLPRARVRVDVRQTVRSLDGELVAEGVVRHLYALRDGLIARMDVSEA